MADSATIIAASLDSSKLEESINKLVETVASKTKEMADNFTKEVGRMEQAVKNLGNIKIDSGGAADGGSSRRTSSLKQEEQQVKSVATSYDGLAKSQQTAIGSRGGSALKKDIDEAANSYSGLIKQIERTQAKFDISPIQNLRMRQHELEAGMQTAANEAAKAKKDVDELNAAISNYRKTLETLPKNQQGFANRQAIQKEINDLITLRDASVSEQQKWTNAGRVLATQYESVKGEIRQIGQALVDSEKAEKQVTSELDKQLQRVKEINSSKSAKAAYESISAMPINTIDQVEAKLQALQALKEKVANTPLLSKSSQSQLVQAITDTKGRIEQLEMAARETNQSKQSLDALNAAISQNIKREEERRNAILQTGIAAQEAFAKIRQSTQIQFADNTDKPIMGVKELTEAIRNMERAYWGMDAANRESPLGQSLQRDIENAQKLRTAIEAYNKTLLGLPVIQDKSGIDKTLGSYTELSALLKTLSNEYRHLGQEERNAAKGSDLADKIQRLSRATQKIQQQMNRPISFAAAMKGDEKTLDDIAYKMQRLHSYRQGIDLTKPNAANEIKQVDEALAKLQKDADKWMNKSQEMIKNNTALGRSWNYMKNRLAFYFTVGASTQFIKNLVEVRSQYEMNERALGILIDSAERGTQIFNELSQMALVSPYTLIELSSAAKQLTAYDVAAKDVVDTTRRMADIAAAVGIPIERLTYALGQIKAYGYLNSRDARMFANAGIPLVKQLSDYYTELEGRLVSTADVYDRIKKKAIDYNEVMEVINKMTDQGGKFFNFQAKMADTLKVQLANLALAWNNMLNDIGKSEQGVIVSGIKTLKELFLRWKDIESVLFNIAIAFGVVKLGQIAYIALSNKVSISTAAADVASKKLVGTLYTMKGAFTSLISSPTTWWMLLATAAVSAGMAIHEASEKTEEFNKSIREGAKDNYDNITKFLEQYKSVRDSLYKTEKEVVNMNVTKFTPTGSIQTTIPFETNKDISVAQDIDDNEAKKAWEEIREQIELTTTASDAYIGKLLAIENVSERLRQAFNILDDIKTVNAALKEISDDTFKVSQQYSGWWNAWMLPDGLKENLKDYSDEVKGVGHTWGDVGKLVAQAHRGWLGLALGIREYTEDADTKLQRFRDDLQETTDSILDFIELKGWSADSGKINQVFEQVTKKIIEEQQLDPQEAFALQTEMEEARSKAAKEALLKRINDEKEAYKISHDEQLRQSINADIARYNSWNETNGRSKVEWERFTKWLKEQHISETTAMFRNMDAEDIKSLNFQEGKHAEWVTRMVTQYAKEHKMSIDDVERYLKNFVRNANQMSIFIPLTISTENKKSVYDQLGEYDMAVDAADAEIERLTTRIGELTNKKKLDKDETNELTRAEKELSDAQKAKADAEARGGHGKKEKKDERASQKAAKQAESELAKALKDELSTIEKIRSIYKDLTKEGMSHADAVAKATKGWDETVNAINKVLQKNGLKKLNLADFVGVDNPREMMKTLQAQLESMVKRGASASEIKVIQEKIRTLEVDADKYDLTKITKGLNNELDKLKEEYELAVELDANPEIGDMFADMFGIDANTLPQTFGEALDRAQEIINRKLSDLNIASPFDLMQSDVNEFANSSGLEKESEAIKELAKWQNTFRDMFKKNLLDSEKMLDDYVKKYGGYSDKIAEIEADRLEKIKKLNDAYYTEEMRQRPEYIAKMNAINQGASREKSNVEFDAFKNSRYYTMMFENLDYVSTKTIRDMRDRLRELMDSMNDLTPEQLKQVMTQYEKLEQKLVKRSPFKTLAKDFKNYLKTSGNRKAANEAFRNAQKEYDAQEKNVAALKEKYEQAKANNNTSQSYLDFLKIEIDGENEILQILKEQLKVAEEKADKYNLIKKLALEELSQTATMVAENLKGLAELRDQMNELFGIDASKGETLLGHKIDGLIDGLSKVSDGISRVTSSAQSGNVFGVVGGVVDVFTGIGDSIASIFGGGAARTRRLNREINKSRETVRQLGMAYDDLERAINKSLGTGETEARRLAIANKEAQLAELERQKELEQSKRSKDRDDDAIKQYEESIHSLRNEIEDLKEDVINNLFGEDVKSAAEAFVDAWVQAWRAGETTFDAIQEKMDEMIYNLIKKAMTSKIVETLLSPIYSELDRMTKKSSDGGVALTTDELRLLAQQAGITAEQINVALGEFYGNLEQLGIVSKTEDKSSELSALQQGIQGITEDTAGALEAYMNIVSQQVFLHSELLTQIRDAVVGFDLDIQLATMSQILLQLQSSYTVQMSIQGILEGALNPSGQGFRVELIS